jgi:hypothetical protein
MVGKKAIIRRQFILPDVGAELDVSLLSFLTEPLFAFLGVISLPIFSLQHD